MSKPTDDQYRDAAVLLPGVTINHEARVIRGEAGAFVAAMIWVPESSALAVGNGTNGQT